MQNCFNDPQAWGAVPKLDFSLKDVPIALTGASSFTGYWIARALIASGARVWAHLTRYPENYSGLPAQRVRALLELGVEPQYGLRAESGDYAQWICQFRPQIWIHHHHWMAKFRQADYDFQRAEQMGVQPLPNLVQALGLAGVRGVVFTGSYFEKGEAGRPVDAPLTPYARSKSQVWEVLRKECAAVGVPLSKFVTPNPFGPLENEDRLIPQLILAAKQRRPFQLASPQSRGDQLPVQIMAQDYVKLCSELLSGRAHQVRPSGYQGTLGNWVEVLCQELLQKRMGIFAEVQKGDAPAQYFLNPASQARSIFWDQVFDEYAAFEKQKTASVTQ